MVDFAEGVDDEKLQNKLINALNRKKPFQNFKWHIDNPVKIAKNGLISKKMRYIQWVNKQFILNHKKFQ